MAGEQELLRVAELMRLCAATATLIGKLRPAENREEIDELSDVVTEAADRLEMVVTRTEKTSDGTDPS